MIIMLDTVAADLRVLLALRIRGIADTPVVAARAELSEDDVKSVLDSLVGTGEVEYKETTSYGSYWRFTNEGQSRVLALLAKELDGAGARVAVTETYERFLAVDLSFKELCTDWQMLPGDDPETRQLNDHADRGYDTTVVARLSLFDERMQPIYADFATHLQRFAGYGPRFAHALDHVQGGDHDWFASPRVESYHHVWQELHYNLQSTLGIDRAGEEASRAAAEPSG